MSQEKPLGSDEILDEAADVVNKMREHGDLSNAEVVMVLDTAKTMQIQQIVIDVLIKGPQNE